MAHLQDIPRHRCSGKCGRWAVVELINDRSAAVGYFCRRCGERALTAFEKHRDEYLKTWGARRTRELYGSR